MSKQGEHFCQSFAQAYEFSAPFRKCLAAVLERREGEAMVTSSRRSLRDHSFSPVPTKGAVFAGPLIFIPYGSLVCERERGGTGLKCVILVVFSLFLSDINPFPSFSLLQVKLDTKNPGAPSRVIHIRNIPNEVTEAEIVHLGIPFGKVTNVLVLKGKNQVSKPRRREIQETRCEKNVETPYHLPKSCGFDARQVLINWSMVTEVATAAARWRPRARRVI